MTIYDDSLPNVKNYNRRSHSTRALSLFNFNDFFNISLINRNYIN